MDAWTWVLAIIAATSVGLAKGGLSMVGVISVLLLALVMSPVQAAGILLPVYIISDIGGLVAYRRNFDRHILGRLLPGAVAGILLGWATASFVTDRAIEFVVGVIGLVFALRALIGQGHGAAARAPDWGRGSLWGLVSGYTSFVAHAGAPPYQVYAQPLRMTPVVYAGTTTIFFAICNMVKLVPYALLGQLSAQNLKVAAVLVIPALLAVRAGLWIVRRMPVRIFYAFITWTLLIVSLRLIWAGVMG
ncbi:sulfite exporter TauE/SafE family protein [Paracoccus sp. DMF-8]|uniref:sulfite exporter TauE/SafE family protein n=1 Tax=Paracoccus sp. DMF-8 TaxID=3019445 RepID=UPI0023E3E203|nr:sulfite exporter TauE/SafE family protein [Paracoccus sp. DMF-8]MDF3607817.1 sulfite exporter TauE/SafE family protein [Paracoccus sp. DMF-8]